MADLSEPAAFLASATISTDIFSLRPDYRALLIIASNIPPGPSDAHSEALLVSAETAARAALTQAGSVQELPHVAAWREAYKAFGAKPNKTRNSLEALTRRIEGEGGGLPRVNRLTDIYNAVSVKHQIPFGGEDLAKYAGAPRLIRADGTEPFHTTAKGQSVIENPEKGEVVWCDADGVTCRRWNWRQGPRTALTDHTRDVLFILDVLNPTTDVDLEAAVEDLIAALRVISSDIRFERRLMGASSVQTV